MKYASHVLFILLAAVSSGGCSGDYKVAPVPAAESGPEGTIAPQSAATPLPAPDASVPVQTTENKTHAGAGAASTRYGGSRILLSAGVALAQTLPTGTAMGFSVDYRFKQGGPITGSRYVWVIEGTKPEPVRQDVQLGMQGTLQTFVPQWRPENGPFRCHIEDDSGQPLSESEALR